MNDSKFPFFKSESTDVAVENAFVDNSIELRRREIDAMDRVKENMTSKSK